MAFSGAEKTRFSMKALYTRPAGSFAGKAIEGATGRIMSSLASGGGLAYQGGIAGAKGGLAG